MSQENVTATSIETFTAAQVAEKTGRAAITVRKQAERGNIGYKRPGTSTWVFTQADIDYLNNSVNRSGGGPTHRGPRKAEREAQLEEMRKLPSVTEELLPLVQSDEPEPVPLVVERPAPEPVVRPEINMKEIERLMQPRKSPTKKQ